jgi:Sec-independent protein translocase protein TatA
LLSPADLAIAFVAGLLLFGPEGLPQVARKAGKIVREVQNTSQAFVREMERIADIPEAKVPPEGEDAPARQPPRDSGSNESH